ncbi:large subunit ribosomal protein L8e [Pancytospora philotis]|nr:large subunit ribosomal protein L8e [Pancytospora philotis]
MSKVLRKFRQEKKKNRAAKEYIKPAYPAVDNVTEYIVEDIVHERGRGAPHAVVRIGDECRHIMATEGMAVGAVHQIGDNVEIRPGNITSLKNISEGLPVNSVEREANDGGFYALTAGTYCTIVNHRKELGQTVLKMPSGTKIVVNSSVRAMIGMCASAGITEKPLLKAGTTHFLKKSRGQLFPRVRGVAMNPVDHHHGGGNKQHIGFPSTVARSAPYAQQVGLIAARSTGRRTGAKKNK